MEIFVSILILFCTISCYRKFCATLDNREVDFFWFAGPLSIIMSVFLVVAASIDDVGNIEVRQILGCLPIYLWFIWGTPLFNREKELFNMVLLTLALIVLCLLLILTISI